MRNDDVVVKVKVGPVVVSLKGDDRIAQHITAGKKFEPDTLDFFAKCCVKDEWVLDIGCYSGLFSIAAEKLGSKALGFEPYPPNQQQIWMNQKLNDCEFSLSTYALSDKNGTGRFGHHKNVHLTSGGSLERKTGDHIDVPIRTLDKCVPIDMKICVIKMDVERHEPAVLRGGKETILRERPVLIIEANDEVMRKAVLDLVLDWGYELTMVLDVRNLILQPVS